jgi:hypothetical protein
MIRQLRCPLKIAGFHRLTCTLNQNTFATSQISYPAYFFMQTEWKQIRGIAVKTGDTE